MSRYKKQSHRSISLPTTPFYALEWTFTYNNDMGEKQM